MLKRCLVFAPLILFVLAANNAFNVHAQQIVPAKLASAESEAARKADEFLAQWDKKDLPGCAVGAMKDGKLIYKRAFGMANLDYDVPNTDATLFNIASASKPFTAMSIALLAQKGKLSLADDVRKYIPELPKYAETITIRHLLDHTSGIREYQALVFFAGINPDNASSDKSVLEMLARQKNVSFAPGTKHQYSNSNYHLLGIIVGRVSGKSLREFADENIFKPLGMKNTMYFDNRFEVVKNRASGYRVGQDKSIRARASLFDLVGGGGILTNIEDLSLWMQNFDAPKIGGSELINLLTAPGNLKNGEKIGYSFGLFHNKYKGLPVIKHSGNMTGFRAQIVAFPEQKFTAIAMCNNSAIFPSVIAEKLADIYLEGQFKSEAPNRETPEATPPSVELSEKDAERYAGVYASKESGGAFKLIVKNGKLISSGLLRNDVPVKAIAEKHLLMVADDNRYELLPIFGASGRISEIKLIKNGGKPDIFVSVKPPLDTPAELAKYAGTYYSDELNADYKLALEDKTLILRIGDNFENRLNAASADYFTMQGGVVNLSFTRDAQGKISGFVFNSAADEREVKGIKFVRR